MNESVKEVNLKREKKIDEKIEALKATHKELILFKFGDKPAFIERERISSGSIGLDRALGGGFVKGSLNQIVGPKSAGKTTLCLHTMAEAQKSGRVLFVDLEHSFDPKYAKALGVNIDELFLAQPEFAEQAFDVIEALISTGEFSLIIVDSIPALLPKAELTGDPGDSHMGLIARLNRQHLRRVIHPASVNGTTIIYINQITYKIGVMFGNPETTPGGTGFNYFCSSILDVRSINTMKISIEKESIRVRARTTKNKTYIPFQEAEFDIRFGKGIDRCGEILDLAVAKKVIERSGSWYSFGANRLGQGRDKAVEVLRDSSNEICAKILTKLKEV